MPLPPRIPPAPVSGTGCFAVLGLTAHLAGSLLQVPPDDVGMLVDKFLSCHILLRPVYPSRVAVELLPDRADVFQVRTAFAVLGAVAISAGIAGAR